MLKEIYILQFLEFVTCMMYDKFKIRKSECITMVVKRNVTQQVVDYFIEQIQKGNWKVGKKIPSENKLTETLGVSRSSVRAAIQQFVGIEIMQSIQGKGTYLISNDLSIFGVRDGNNHDYDYKDMSSLMEFRLIIEPECCALAIKRLESDTIDNLAFYLEKMQESIGNQREFVKYDLLFHEAIVKCTKNPLLINALRDVFSKKLQSFLSFNEAYGYIDGIYYHKMILKAFEERDASRAKRLMRSHLQKALDDIYFDQNIEQ